MVSSVSVHYAFVMRNSGVSGVSRKATVGRASLELSHVLRSIFQCLEICDKKNSMRETSIITLIDDHFVDFIDRIGPLSAASAGRGVNIVSWMEMVTFDILGEMAFGESFHCIDEEKHHPWIDLILKHLLEITLVDNLRRFHLLATLGKWLLPRLTVAVRNQHSDSARRKVKRRLQNDNGRQDFLTNIVSKVKGGEVSEEELSAHASTLM